MTERIKTRPETEILSDILETLRFRSTIFLRSPLAAPWGFSLEQEPAPRFHVSIDGQFFVGGEQNPDPVEVGEMEIVILPNGRSHWIAELIHRRPEAAWTIDDLAGKAALSRATLVRRFRESVGMAPMEYLTRWRLLKAHQLARYSADSIDRIAGHVGFSSAQTLTRAFKRLFGVTPSSFRRQALS